MSKYKKIIEKYLTLYHIPSSKTLLWLRISKKLGKANKRNLLKRRIRESFRNLNKKLHVIITVKTGKIPTYKEIDKDLKKIVSRIN